MAPVRGAWVAVLFEAKLFHTHSTAPATQDFHGLTQSGGPLKVTNFYTPDHLPVRYLAAGNGNVRSGSTCHFPGSTCFPFFVTSLWSEGCSLFKAREGNIHYEKLKEVGVHCLGSFAFSRSSTCKRRLRKDIRIGPGRPGSARNFDGEKCAGFSSCESCIGASTVASCKRFSRPCDFDGSAPSGTLLPRTRNAASTGQRSGACFEP